ncbi:MAG TPA: tetratricopeptide repeat protein, partial [Acidobacteriota bacterium]|nr:tetratricopeptide repeat protein [Acidobacteriota bacterium]
RKALEFDPNHAESHYQLGITLIGLGEMEEALEHLKTYVKLSPNTENAQVAQQLIQELGG